jgi:hypothetical protein
LAEKSATKNRPGKIMPRRRMTGGNPAIPPDSAWHPHVNLSSEPDDVKAKRSRTHCFRPRATRDGVGDALVAALRLDKAEFALGRSVRNVLGAGGHAQAHVAFGVQGIKRHKPPGGQEH